MRANEDAGSPADDRSSATTRTLLLLRHASAGTPPATTDRDRPLSDHGRAEAAAVGHWLADQQRAGHWGPITTVLCSPARRTRETLQGLRLDVRTRFVEMLYGGGVPDIVRAVAAVPPASATVLVVGHAPGIPSTAADLDGIATQLGATATDRPVLQRFPPASLAALRTTADWSDLGERGAELIGLRHP